MNETVRARSADPPAALTPEQEATARAAGVWINQFARTLKTCRLYDANNPTVVRFRSELAAAAARVLDEHGPMRLRFSSEDVLCEEVSLYPAKSRDDNLALAFFRDGVRGLTLQPGLQASEVDTLLDAVMHVTSQTQAEDDLVTLLWEAQLQHIEIDFVPTEGDVGTGPDAPAQEEEAPLLPWPAPPAEDPNAAPAEAATVETVENGSREDRSDDWTAGDETVEIEAGFEELEALSKQETQRFQHEYQAEHQVPILTASIAISQAYLAAGANADDRLEMGRFLPRLLRQAVAQGNWLEARAALLMLRECPNNEWAPERFVQDLLQPISVTNLVERLDAHEASGAEFVAFASEFGPPAVDVFNHVLAESQNRLVRRLLAEAIAERCKDNPERLAPWIADPRWFVVRNVVHILGWIGSPAIVGLLQSALRNPDPRVKQEVVAALGQVDPRLARPLLLRMIDGADSRLLLAALHQLSVARDTGVARVVMRIMQAEDFDARPAEEKRAIYTCLGAAADNPNLPELEAELHKGNWFSRNQEVHRQAIARAIARVGTPAARLILERGITSKRLPLRKACEEALAGFHARG
ncbi:MAG TPA: HEAT repeat domain-containing protein [Candidatus Sulfotelmatobacter sp.]|nr:HEAT repeat domain-containing protein [Candidatus Sulfotelmatobacter sp.]